MRQGSSACGHQLPKIVLVGLQAPNGLLALVFLNPIDLGRITILLQLDIAALMGYTGAVFQKTFGTDRGLAMTVVAMLAYATVPLLFGLRTFRRKDF